ncbi:MAG: hypothetical protein WCK89_16440, partial [bacterium]
MKRLFSSIVLSGCLFGSLRAETAARHEVRAPGLKLTLSADGRIVGLTVGDKGAERAMAGETLLEGCRTQGAVAAKTLQNGGMEFTRTLVADNPPRACQLVERFTPTRNSVRWEIEILGKGVPWSTEILTQLAYPATPQTRFWIAGCGDGGWVDPLTVMPLKNATFDYGAPSFRLDNPRLAFCPGWGSGNIICLPLVSVMEPETDTGLSLILSPEDTSREIMLRMTASGRFAFARDRHRIDAQRPVKFSMDLVAHEAGWRGALRWITARYPQFFDPVNPQAHDMGGTAAYSCKDVDFDAEKMRKMAFRVNWRASFDFPYMGMFIPPVSDTETWPRFGGAKTSLPAMRDYAAKMRELGFYVLSYFNVAEFGAHITWPLPARKAERDEDLWKNAHDFLGAKLSSAIRRPSSGTQRSNQKAWKWRPKPGGGVVISRQTRRPPGRVTRNMPANAAGRSCRLRTPKAAVTAAKRPAANGSCSASPETNVTRLLRVATSLPRACSSMRALRSRPTTVTSAAVAARPRVRSPVPQHTS